MPQFRGKALDFTVSGLEKDTEYSFRVAAINEAVRTCSAWCALWCLVCVRACVRAHVL